MDIIISWYGRCCFLVELNQKKILFDPYDTYCNVDVGIIDADILISSSTWHDHGHIGASPQAMLYSYPGVYEDSGFVITGIEAKENRGTPTVVFNLKYKDISITNFADLGPSQDEEFKQNLTQEQNQILQSTNIAFIRPDIVGDDISDHNIHSEKALEYCNPAIIFPEHYFPRDWVETNIPEEKKPDFLLPNQIVEEMISIFNRPVEVISSYTVEIDTQNLGIDHKIYQFLQLHPQVHYGK